MAELERLMVEENEGLIFSSEQYLTFLEKHFNVSFLKIRNFMNLNKA